MSNWTVVLLLAYAAWGCQAIPAPKPGPIPATNSAIDKANAHTTSAESINKQIVPHADKTGKALSSLVSGEHAEILKDLNDAKQAVAAVQVQVDNLTKQVATISQQRDSYKNSWGYRLEVFVQAFLTTIIVVYSLHFLLGVAAMVLPLFFPASIVAVPILKKLAAVFNPAAWFQYAVDHFHPCPTPTLVVKAG